MAETKAHRIRVILDFLIDEGCLAVEGALSREGVEYPVVVLGRGFEEVLKGQRRLCMKLPRERKEHIPSPNESLLPAKAGNRRPGGPPKVSVPATASAGADISAHADVPIETGVDKALFEKLKTLRKEIALREGVPAYIVFTDASLRDMCRKKPQSIVQFSAVNGVGSVKLGKYGEAFVNQIIGRK